MIVSIRVRPFVHGRPTSGTADSAPFARLVGRLGHRFERFDLHERQIAELRAAGVFDIADDAGTPNPPKREVVKLVPRTGLGKIIKLAGV